MNIISLIGILVGIAVFVVLAFKNFNLLLSALFASLIIILFSGMPAMETITGLWMESLSGFIKAYFLVFILSSLFGQTMAEGKASTSIAVAFAGIVRKSKRNQKLFALLFVPFMYALLSYIGISGVVIVFTVLSMGRDLFQECDVPWRFYCYGGAASAGMFLGGNLQLQNIMLSDMFGTGLTAGMALSIIGVIVFYACLLFLCIMDLNKAEKNGEGFMNTGAPMKNDSLGKNTGTKENLPPVALAFVPMVTVIIIAAVFNQVLIALIAGILLNIILFHKYMPDIKTTIATGVTSGFAPVINVAATVGISAVIATAPGFSMVSEMFGQLPAVIGGPLMIASFTFLTASPTGIFPVLGPQIFENMVASGITAGAAHRIMSASVFTCIGPHSPAVVNSTMLTKIEFPKAVLIYLKATIIPGTIAVTVMILCAQLGVFS